jgi:chromosome segregation ATPase
MSAGAAVALLGLFLVASERELKTKRRDIQELLMKLENAAANTSAGQSTQLQSDRAAELSELRAQNRELQNQLTAISRQMASNRTGNDFVASQQGADDWPDTQHLRAANEQLSREVTELRNRLEASAAQIRSSASQNQQTQDSYAGLQTEISSLRRALDASEARVQELETAQRKLPDLDTIEAENLRQRQGLHERIAELEGRLSSAQEKFSELQTMRDRLAEAESVQALLQEEIRRHEAEIPRWQARLAAAEQHGQRLAALQQPWKELFSKQAALAEEHRRLQEELAAFARLMETPVQPSQPLSSGSSANAASPVENGAQSQSHAAISVTPSIVPAQAEAAAQAKQTKTARSA